MLFYERYIEFTSMNWRRYAVRETPGRDKEDEAVILRAEGQTFSEG